MDRASTVRARWGLAPQWLREPAFWLSGLVLLAGMAYVSNYTQAAESTLALLLLGGLVLGQGTAVWAEWRPKSKGQRPTACGTVVTVLLVLLAAAALWDAETQHLFHYRGQARWSEPWDNPNTFGLLMGMGAVLALGSLKSKVQSLRSKVGSVCLVGAAVVMAVGLVRSYSRGAWVGAAVGLAYLAWGSRPDWRWQMANGKAAANGKGWKVTVMASLLVLAFWGLRETGGLVARRAYSVANANDFSWRNRVAAYEGALAMLAERPWFGFGWNQPERVYDGLYRSAKVEEGMAIQMNDYFMLGMTLGVPALGCFAVYLWLALGRGLPIADSRSQMADGRGQRGEGEWLKAVCRAGAVVLAVGFWFDGGLFRLATGAVFWVLLELGREEGEGRRQNEECRTGLVCVGDTR